MALDWSTLALQAVNFLILVGLLQYFLYRPVLAVIDRRQQATERAIAAVNAAKTAAEATAAELEAQRQAIAKERERALQDAYQRAQGEASEVLAEVRRQADHMLAEARAQIERERDEAAAALRERALGLALEMARRLLAAVADREVTAALLRRTLAQLRALPAHERQELAADGAMVEVVTAQPLEDGAAERCRAALREVLGEATAVTFSHDPALLAGVELRFPHGAMRGSWRDSLAAITEELKRDGRPARVA